MRYLGWMEPFQASYEIRVITQSPSAIELNLLRQSRAELYPGFPAFSTPPRQQTYKRVRSNYHSSKIPALALISSFVIWMRVSFAVMPSQHFNEGTFDDRGCSEIS